MTRALLSLLVLLCVAACRYNLAGYLQEAPAATEIVGNYHLDLDKSQDRLRRMGYKNFTGQITLGSDGSFTATNLPACCVHGWDESTYPFSGGHYSLSGTWKIAKSSAVYVVSLTLSVATMTEPPVISDASVLKEDRKAPGELQLHLIKGNPLLLGFSIFNGDFDDVVFSKSKK
jgi:hypothetical protein